MAIQTDKDNIKLSQIVCQKNEDITIQGDVIVNDVKPDVLKVISTSGIVCVYKREVLNGKIKIEGCVNTYIIYLADDENGNVRTLNTSLDFAEIIDMENCKEGMNLEDKISIKGFETKVLNGRKLHVKAFLDINLKVCSCTEIETITDIVDDEENVQMLNSSKRILSLIVENTGKTTLKDTIKLNTEDELAEIMKVSFSLTDVQTKTSYNKVLIKANANVGIMYLTEDNRISNVNNTIPLMGFIDMQNITDASKCFTRVTLKNLILRDNNNEENALDIEADIELSCKAYEEKDVNIIEDVYSTISDIELKTEEIDAKKDEFTIKDNFTINQRLDNPELMYGKILGLNVVPNLEDIKIANGKIEYNGKINTEIIVSSENSVSTVTNDIPFQFELSSEDISKSSNIETQINVVSQKLLNTDDGVVLNVELEVNALIQNNDTLNFVQDVNVLEPKSIDTYSMVIYFVKPGDTLWKIAKQFKSTVEDIARVNGLEKEDTIYPGEQLYIPKSNKCKLKI